MEGKMGNPPPYQGPPYQSSPHPQQHPYPQQQPVHPVIVVPGPVQTTPAVVSTVMVSSTVGPKPSPMTCRSCGAQIVTRVEYQTTTKTHVMAFLLFIFGCWCCCCIPYCTDSCRNADHYCPNCNAYIGAYIS